MVAAATATVRCEAQCVHIGQRRPRDQRARPCCWNSSVEGRHHCSTCTWADIDCWFILSYRAAHNGEEGEITQPFGVRVDLLWREMKLGNETLLGCQSEVGSPGCSVDGPLPAPPTSMRHVVAAHSRQLGRIPTPSTLLSRRTTTAL